MSSRISSAQMYNTANHQVADAREKETDSSNRASSMKQMNRPSDNPTGWVQVENIRDEFKTTDTIVKNMSLAQSQLNMTDSVLAQITDLVQRAHELAVAASSESVGREQTRQALLPEVKANFSDMIRLLNTRFGGRTLLGGYQTMAPAYDSDGTQLGDDGVMEVEIGNGVKIPLNLNPGEVIHGKNNITGVSIPDVVRSLVMGLENNDIDQVRSTLPALLQGIQQLSLGRGEVAARMQEIERVSQGQEIHRIDQQDTISKIEEADAVKAFSDLTRDQTVLRAAMSTAQKILAENPVDILFR